VEGVHFHVLLTHYHWDHVEGLPFFRPLYDPRCSFTFYGFPWQDLGVQQALETGLRPPWFPIPIGDTASSKTFVDLTESAFGVDRISVSTTRLCHPQGARAFRLEHSGRAIVFATDTEHGDGKCDAGLLDLSKGANVLIHDAQYTPEEYDYHRGHGHSTWRHALEVARGSDAEQLILFHHDPDRSDDDLDSVVAQARSEFEHVEGAREGTSLSL
jgi:phosphoribosyl 1,2-cyclic phosphodiesterase